MRLIKQCSLKIYAGSLLFLLSFLPFVSPLPLGSDVQPLAHIYALLLLFSARQFRFVKVHQVFILLSVIFSVLYFPFGNVGDVNIVKAFALPIAFTFYLAVCSIKYEKHSSIIKFVILLYFILSILFLLFPEQFIKFQSFFVRNVNSKELGYRGISTLSTEPGLFAGMMVAIFAILKWYWDKKIITNREFLVLATCILLMILWSKSGTGMIYLAFYLLLMIFFAMSFFTRIFISLFIAGSLMVLLSMGSEFSLIKNAISGEYGRGWQVFSILIFNFEKFMGDSSILYRLYALTTAFISTVQYPMGVGHDEVLNASNNIVSSYPFLADFYSQSKFGFRLVSSFGYYLTAFGLVFLCFIGYLLYTSKSSWENKILAMLLLSFSYSIIFPLIWVLLALGKNNVRN
ncbi:hypothetical protein ACN0IJ_10595 [Shewanella indica]|uniref:hypothetical protein n=1 Tax=Shewanella indica TaxID=768528 RepID=UPI003D36E889